MIRASRVSPAGKWNGAAADTVELDHDQRHRRRIVMRGKAGLEFLLDLTDAVPLRDGDGLTLEDGRVVAVVAAPEPLAEIIATSAAELLRVAWHLGNRHLPTQLSADRIRVHRDHVIEAMIEGLGATVTHVDAPFDPEGGAYQSGTHGEHDHRHDRNEHDDRLEEEESSRG